MCDAYKSGRSDKDPAEGWYKGEIWFFDNYSEYDGFAWTRTSFFCSNFLFFYTVIPLAKKLKDCGVFGVSSDEYLGYAVNNRREWEKKGSEIVAEWIEELAKQV